MQTVLVTGGAGYIGSHACKVLRDAVYLPVTYDNLSTGWADAVKFGPFAKGDLLDRAALRAVILSDPMPPLPNSYPRDRVGVHLQFTYSDR